jgi:HNH endonuclease
MPHSKSTVQAYVRLLRRADSPEVVVDYFLRLVEIDNGIFREDGSLESLERLFVESCRNHNFAKPFDSERGKAYFRPSQIPEKLPQNRGDLYGSGEDFCPKEEQAFRRGYAHGFGEAKRLVEGGQANELKVREDEIHRWRISRIWRGASPAGTVESFDLKLLLRSPVPAKRRWDVIQRDNRRCVACGASAGDGVTLHVDHILSVYNGGGNEMENLQTLCDRCNLGKGRD